MTKASKKSVKIVKDTEVTQPTKPVFNPQANYKWTADTQFSLSAIQFNILFSVIKEDISTPGGTSAINKVDAYTILTQVLQQAVEEGKAVETPVEPLLPTQP